MWAHLPPHHSEGQPHGPGVVDDVSSHLGLQEGALSQAPVLVSRDLLGSPRERDSSAAENLPHLLPTSKHVIPSSHDYHEEGRSGWLWAGPEAERGAQSTDGDHSVQLPAQERSGLPGEVGRLKSQEDIPQTERSLQPEAQDLMAIRIA